MELETETEMERDRAMRTCGSCGELGLETWARYCGQCGAPMPIAAGLTLEAIARWSGGSDYYPRAFARLFPTGAISLKPSWNWAAALVPFWMLYRGLVREAFICFGLLAVIGYSVPALGLAVWVAQGLFGNALYFMALERRVLQEVESSWPLPRLGPLPRLEPTGLAAHQ